MIPRGYVCLGSALAWTLLAACSGGDAPMPTARAGAAPDSFVVAFETSAGEFHVALRRDWSPAGVDRVYELARSNFYAGARIYRVNERYAQFGYTGRPEVDAEWIDRAIPDEPVRASNVRGSVSFARGGPESRSVILFINRGDNSNLDAMEWRGVLGFPPIGRVVRGMEVVDALHGGYGEEPLQWEDSIASIGNPFLDRRYPLLDSIIRVRVVEEARYPVP
jgi:cyclophilin family peptidyl-prolyl cis-trans isomerase